MVFSSLEDTILPDNPVRFIGAFVNSIDLVKIGLKVRMEKTREEKEKPDSIRR